MSAGSIISLNSINSTRRPVARRACLSCREKKIKCDGEPISTVTSDDGTNNKIIPQSLRVCSNCKFLGIECVFVQSMRGGRRKKRVTTENNDNPKLSKSAKANDSMSSDYSDYKNEGSTGDRDNSMTENLKSYMLDQSNNTQSKPLSPTLSYSTSYTEPFKRSQKERTDLSGDLYNQHLQYEYTRDYPCYPPPHHHRRGHYGPPNPPPPHLRRHPYGPPYPPPHPHHMLGYPPHHHKRHHWGAFPLPPPHHRSHHWGAYPLPPPPPPHVLGYSPPPMAGSYPAPSEKSERYPNSGSGSAPESQSALYEDTNGKPTLPPIDGSSVKSYSEYSSSYYQHPSRSIETKSENNGEYQPLSASSSASSGSINNDMVSERDYSPYHLNGTTKVYRNEISNVPVQPFSNNELSKYELPNWETLNKIIDNYYIFNQPSHQLLSSKYYLLNMISLNLDCSIIHAIISTVCLIESKEIQIERDENYWISKVFKFWNNLNDFGMLLCYALISKTSTIKYNLDKFIDLNIKIWELVESNKYIELLSAKPRLSLNSRQVYERELIMRIIWDYWINHIVMFRFQQGYPYYKLSMINNDFKLNYELDNYTNNLPLPLSNADHLKMGGKRRDWKDLDDFNFSKQEISDSNSVIVSIKFFEIILNKISKDELTEAISVDKDFTNFILTRYSIRNNEKKLIIINSSYLLSNFIINIANCLQYSYFLNDIIIFKLSKFQFNQQQSSKHISLLNDFSITNLLNFEELPTVIGKLTDFQWTCIINLIISTLDIIKLIELEDDTMSNGFKIVVGVSNQTDQISWDNPDLVTNQKDLWLRYPDFSLVCSCSLLPILTSLIILTKFIKFNKSNDQLKIKLSSTEAEKVLKLASPINEVTVKEFEVNHLLKKLSSLINFIKFRLQFDNENIINDTLSKINKISHYLEEILNSIK